MITNTLSPANNPEFDFAQYRIGIDEIEANYAQGEQENKGLFTLKTANKWMRDANLRPIPKMLFGEFWFERELCILFADTNLGKSILAVQIADSISRGVRIPGFKFESERQSVLYFDFELADKQFENRYSFNYQGHYQFNDNFIRVEINPDADIPDGQFEDFLNYSLERSIIETGAKVLIIDNITYLKNETEKAKDALPLMKHLKTLKSKYGLSILALAHTPKRDFSKPLTKNDLQGSKMLINFCDSAFTIGEAHTDKSLRYIKQIKARNTEIIYDTDNVCMCTISKPLNFLQFEFNGFGQEKTHLRQQSDSDKDKLVERILELNGQGKSYREIAVEIGNISHAKVGRIIKEYKPVTDCNAVSE